MQFGVLILPEYRWSVGQTIWKRAEELGFDHAWTYDHLAWRSLRDSTWFDAVPTLTAAALATEHIRIGTLVASPNFRHPLAFARELIALDDISGGRITVGIGAGGQGWDATILGQAVLSKADKAARFEEFVTLLDHLLTEPITDWQGRFYSTEAARTIPGCVQQPRIPFAIAATGPRGMKLAAHFGATWVTTGESGIQEPLNAEQGAKVIQGQMAQLDEICAQVGRDPATLRRIVLTGPNLKPSIDSKAALEDTVGRYAEIGVTDLVTHWPRPEAPFAADINIFEEVFAQHLSAGREPSQH